jgi:hypothetical protein
MAMNSTFSNDILTDCGQTFTIIFHQIMSQSTYEAFKSYLACNWSENKFLQPQWVESLKNYHKLRAKT